MAIRLMQGDAVVAVPGVRDGLPRVLGNTTFEMEGRLWQMSPVYRTCSVARDERCDGESHRAFV